MQPKWKKRRLLGIQNARSRIGHEEVIGKENITINGVNYTALIVKITPVDAPPEEENDSWIINYYNSSDLSLIKIVRPGNYTSLFQPPLKEFDYPIQIGKEWRQEVEEIMCLPYGYKERWNLTFHYNCTEKTTIKVPAGTFSCYVMKRDGKSNENSYTLYYISSKVGREVKTKMKRKGLTFVTNPQALAFARQRYAAGLTSNSNHNYNFIKHNPLNH